MSRMGDFIIDIMERESQGKSVDEIVRSICQAYDFQVSKEYVESIVRSYKLEWKNEESD